MSLIMFTFHHCELVIMTNIKRKKKKFTFGIPAVHW